MGSNLTNFAKSHTTKLIPTTGLRGQYGPYIADPALVHAANTAMGLQMPLLLTGEPGCGKSDFAWVAAKALHGETKAPLRCHVRSDTRARDLLYHYDALVRFGETQHGDRQRARDPRHYVSLRPLGAAMMLVQEPRPVVLIDEIDKAPRDLPNDLLHELDEGSFEIPEIGDFDGQTLVHDRKYKEIALAAWMKREGGRDKPLVVITSNAERQLPEPFLRRCVFFHIPSPSRDRLVEIAQARFSDQDPLLTKSLAGIFSSLREVRGLAKTPTTAEMLNWITALTRLYEPNEVKGVVERFSNVNRPSWAELPALGCLLKMQEDVEAVSR